MHCGFIFTTLSVPDQSRLPDTVLHMHQIGLVENVRLTQMCLLKKFPYPTIDQTQKKEYICFGLAAGTDRALTDPLHIQVVHF